MPAMTAITGIVFTNENPGWTFTPFFCAVAIVEWYVSGLFVYGCANVLKWWMKLPSPAIQAISDAMTRPSSENPSSVNMKRFAHVQPAPTASPATMIPMQPIPNCQLWLDATVCPQLTSRLWPPTRPTTINPGTTASVTNAIPSNAIDRKLESEMHDAEMVPSAGCSTRLTMT